MAAGRARAQQSALPVIGFLASFSSTYLAHFMPAFHQGLGESGFTDGQNVIIETHSADGQYDRLARLAAELLDRKVAVIVAAGGSEPAKVAKAATSAIPIVFISAADPVRAGVVTSFNRPGANITGVSLLAESHLACHTFPEFGSLCLNIFCCRPRPGADFEALIKKELDAAKVFVREVERPYQP